MEDFRWLIKRQMAECHISSCPDLCSKVGINYRTLRERFNNSGSVRLYELRELDKILNFTDEQLLQLIRDN